MAKSIKIKIPEKCNSKCYFFSGVFLEYCGIYKRYIGKDTYYSKKKPKFCKAEEVVIKEKKISQEKL